MRYHHPGEIPMSAHYFFEWAGETIPCSTYNVRGDTHPQTWADDGNLYMGAGDPCWTALEGGNYADDPPMGNWVSTPDLYNAMSGLDFEKIVGGPDRFEVLKVNEMTGFTGPGGGGPKPSGLICVEGKLYYAVQNLLGDKPPPFRPKAQHGTDATILCSEDHGKTWQPDLNGLLTAFAAEHFDYAVCDFDSFKTPASERGSYRGWRPMFPGNLFGGPSFVQFGQNNADAVDGYVYALSGDQWDNGRCLRLGRVEKDRIMERERWRFYRQGEDGEPVWERALEAATPILEIEGHIGLPEMVYLKNERKYLLLTWALHTDLNTSTGSELTILEGDAPWGPFSLVHYEWMWYDRDCCPYTPRVPLKWFDPSTLEGYLLHSGSWDLPATRYRPHIRKFRLVRRDK